MQKRKAAELRTTGEDAFFAASNSAHGFQSYYDECFNHEEIDRVFVIKGGPGTGKSRFMREVSDSAVERGFTRRMIYCSSDADSLDGVILSNGKRSIALLDGTAPHVYEPKSPGVREELINLGDFWDSERLKAQRTTIEQCQRAKHLGYRMTYRYLSAYGEIYKNRAEKLLPHVRRKAISEYARRLMQPIEAEPAFEAQTELMGSVGMSGRVRFDTYSVQAKRLYLLEDYRGIGALFMEELYRLAEEKRLRVRVSRDPILPDVIDGLFFMESGVVFVVDEEENCPYPHNSISMRRFVKTTELRSVRKSLNFDQRMLNAMLGEALAQMQEVRRAHFELEQIYSSAMNFEAKEIFTKNFCNRLFDLQNE